MSSFLVCFFWFGLFFVCLFFVVALFVDFLLIGAFEDGM